MKVDHIFLDLDGVFANSAKRIEELTGKPYSSISAIEFWAAVKKDGKFFLNLERIDDSYELYQAIKHLNHSFLTGLPGDPIMVKHKRLWVQFHFGDIEMIATKGRLKHLYASPTAVLIDDTKRNIDLWQQAGGIGILHTSAASTIAELKKLEIL